MTPRHARWCSCAVGAGGLFSGPASAPAASHIDSPDTRLTHEPWVSLETCERLRAHCSDRRDSRPPRAAVLPGALARSEPDSLAGRRTPSREDCRLLRADLPDRQRTTPHGPAPHRADHLRATRSPQRSWAKLNPPVTRCALCCSGSIDYGLVNDPTRAAPVGVMQLLIHDGPWEAITVAMANEIARPRRGGHVLRDLGLVTILLEFCAEQRDHHGGLRAEITRGDIAARAGLTVDRVDDCNRILEQCGILEISRRRSEQGWAQPRKRLRDPRGAEPRNRGRRTRTGRADKQDWQGGERGPAGRRTRTGRAARQDCQGGERGLAGRKFRRPRSRSAALYRVRGGWPTEGCRKHHPPVRGCAAGGGRAGLILRDRRGADGRASVRRACCGVAPGARPSSRRRVRRGSRAMARVRPAAARETPADEAAARDRLHDNRRRPRLPSPHDAGLREGRKPAARPHATHVSSARAPRRRLRGQGLRCPGRRPSLCSNAQSRVTAATAARSPSPSCPGTARCSSGSWTRSAGPSSVSSPCATSNANTPRCGPNSPTSTITNRSPPHD